MKRRRTWVSDVPSLLGIFLRVDEKLQRGVIKAQCWHPSRPKLGKIEGKKK